MKFTRMMIQRCCCDEKDNSASKIELLVVVVDVLCVVASRSIFFVSCAVGPFHFVITNNR